MTLSVLATVQGPVWGWTNTRSLVLIAAAVVAVSMTVLRTLRHPHALIERALFASRPSSAQPRSALFVFYVGFAIFLLSVVLFLQDSWHYSAVRAGLAIAPGPGMAAVFAINAGRITARFGRTLPAVVGTASMAIGAGYWALATGARPEYATAFLPGLLIAGMSSGLTQAPLFAAAGTLAPERATTGSAVLNMSRQVGSAIGVAVVVVILGTAATHSVAEFHHVWLAEVVAALIACAAVLTGRERRDG